MTIFTSWIVELDSSTGLMLGYFFRYFIMFEKEDKNVSSNNAIWSIIIFANKLFF